MSPQELYEIWAPERSVWSPWAKPALFATLHSERVRLGLLPSTPAPDVSWCRGLGAPHTIVLELPGPAAVLTGLALAAHGYRPVPLFNTTCGSPAVHDVLPIAELLAAGADRLSHFSLPDDAPPAFLLDADRMRTERTPAPGLYDNRWLIFPQDFPSAAFLREHGIGGALLVSATTHPAGDLTHVLRRWQDAALPLSMINPTRPSERVPLTVLKPPWYRSVWQRLLVLSGLRRSSAGGFGGRIPEPRSSGGFA